MENIDKKTLISGIAGVLIMLAILFVAWKFSKIETEQKKTDMTVTLEDHIRGNKKSSVVVIEYSDFQCPSCKIFSEMMKPLIKKYEKKVLFVFRHYPLKIHKNAKKAAIAAEAASLQKKFWEMHDILFEKQNEWSTKKSPETLFISYAKKIGLETNKFKEDIKNPMLEKKIEKAILHATQLGIYQTPSLFINGETFENIFTIKDVEEAIKKAISNKSG